MKKLRKSFVLSFKKRQPLSIVFLNNKAKKVLRRVKILLKTNIYESSLEVTHNKKVMLLNLFKYQSKFKNLFRKMFFYSNFFFKHNTSFNLSKNFNIYTKLISFVFKNGKKWSWEQKFANIFDSLSKKLQYTKSALLLKIFMRLFTRVEVKKVKARKRSTLIPVFIKLKRSLFLALKWIFIAAKKKIGSDSFQNKIFLEILQILVHKSCFSLQKCEENNILAFKNRSNLHYRWQRTR